MFKNGTCVVLSLNEIKFSPPNKTDLEFDNVDAEETTNPFETEPIEFFDPIIPEFSVLEIELFEPPSMVEPVNEVPTPGLFI